MPYPGKTQISKGMGESGYQMAFPSLSGQFTEWPGHTRTKGSFKSPAKKGAHFSACEVLDCNLAQQLPGSYGQRTQQSEDTQPSPQDILTDGQILSLRSDMFPQIHKPERIIPPEGPIWTSRFL